MADGKVNRPMVAISWMFLTGLLFVGVTAVVKHVGTDLPPAHAPAQGPPLSPVLHGHPVPPDDTVEHPHTTVRDDAGEGQRRERADVLVPAYFSCCLERRVVDGEGRARRGGLEGVHEHGCDHPCLVVFS